MDHTSLILRMSAGGRSKRMCSRMSTRSSDNNAGRIFDLKLMRITAGIVPDWHLPRAIVSSPDRGRISIMVIPIPDSSSHRPFLRGRRMRDGVYRGGWLPLPELWKILHPQLRLKSQILPSLDRTIQTVCEARARCGRLPEKRLKSPQFQSILCIRFQSL